MAAKSANLYARIEPDVKEKAENILSTLGIPASSAINMFYKQIILQRGLPFEVKLPSSRPVDIHTLSETEFNEELEKGYSDMQAGRAKNASGQLDLLEEHILRLDIMPELYRKYENEPWKSRGLRVLPVDNYVIFYIPDSNKKVVTILRVMYAGRDIENQLKFHTKQSETITSFSANMETP